MLPVMGLLFNDAGDLFYASGDHRPFLLTGYQSQPRHLCASHDSQEQDSTG